MRRRPVADRQRRRLARLRRAQHQRCDGAEPLRPEQRHPAARRRRNRPQRREHRLRQSVARRQPVGHDERVAQRALADPGAAAAIAADPAPAVALDRAAVGEQPMAGDPGAGDDEAGGRAARGADQRRVAVAHHHRAAELRRGGEQAAAGGGDREAGAAEGQGDDARARRDRGRRGTRSRPTARRGWWPPGQRRSPDCTVRPRLRTVSRRSSATRRPRQCVPPASTQKMRSGGTNPHPAQRATLSRKRERERQAPRLRLPLPLAGEGWGEGLVGRS